MANLPVKNSYTPAEVAEKIKVVLEERSHLVLQKYALEESLENAVKTKKASYLAGQWFSEKLKKYLGKNSRKSEMENLYREKEKLENELAENNEK